MDTTIQKTFLSLILQPYLHKNIISIINKYNRSLYYYILVKSNVTLFNVYSDVIFQACSIKDIIKYIVFSDKESEKFFIRYNCEISFSSLRNVFVKSLSKKEKKHFNSNSFSFFKTMPEKKKQISLLAQKLYINNSTLFLKDMYAEEDKEFIKCVSLTEYTDLFKCIKKKLFLYKCEYTNVYTKHKTIINFEQDNNNINNKIIIT